MKDEASVTMKQLVVLMALCWSPITAAAQEIFRTEGDNGVVSFSDIASDGAELIVLPSVVVAGDTFARQQQLIDQQLAVARALEQSRLAREAARTRRLEAIAAAAPRTVVYQQPERTRYVGGSFSYSHKRWGYRPGYPGHPGHRPPHPSHPIAPPSGGGRLNPPSRPVPMLPLKGRGG